MGPATDHDEAALPMPDVADDLEAEGSRIANWWLKARRLREEVFGPELFADPAWDILLDLYTAEARGECVQTSSLAFAARVPHSTAIRWAKIMARAGLIDRHKDPRDARRIHVRLSDTARALMAEYLARLSSQTPAPSSNLVPAAQVTLRPEGHHRDVLGKPGCCL